MAMDENSSTDSLPDLFMRLESKQEVRDFEMREKVTLQ
jgi:hypothetical protein